MNNDRIILKDYEVKACHGVNAEEKEIPQRFLFTVELFYDIEQAAKDDDLSKTISYSDVKKTVKAFCESNCFDLIETLAARLAYLLLKRYAYLRLSENEKGDRLAKKQCELLKNTALDSLKNDNSCSNNCAGLSLNDCAFAVCNGIYSGVKSVRVTVKKPDAPMSGVFDYVAVSVERAWHRAYIALGSSLGDREGYLNFAINALKNDDCFRQIRESKRVWSEPYGGVARESFLNSVVELDTLYSPHDLLSKLNKIEADCNRARDIHWGDRTLDLDIIFYDDLILQDNSLCIPHPDMHNRSFVLEPLCELCKYKLHPILNKRIFELCK